MPQQPQQPTPEQQKKIKGAKIKLWLGMVIIIAVGFLIAVYFVFLVDMEEVNTNNVMNSNIVSNTNVATNLNSITNTNFTITESCDQITDKDECRARADCLPVDSCSCTTVYEEAKRCTGEEINTCRCSIGGFDHCEDLVCDGVRSTQIYNGTVSIECQTVDDCAFYIDKTRDLSECCDGPLLCHADYADSKYVVVNKKSLEQLTAAVRGDTCDNANCPKYVLPSCPEDDGWHYIRQCVNNKCMKVPKF